NAYPCSSAFICGSVCFLAVDAAAGHGGDDIGEIGLLFQVGAGGEVAFGGEPAVDAAGDAGGDGAADVGSAGEHHDHDQLVHAHFVEGTKPAHVAGGLEIGTGAGLAEDGLGGIVARAPGGAEIDGAAHAELDVLDASGSELQRMFHLGCEIIDFVLGARVLEIVHGAAVGDGAEEGGELQGRHGNAGAEAGHHTDAAVLRGFEGEVAGLLAGDLEAGFLAEAEHFRVVVNAVEAEPGAEDIEVLVVGAGQRLSESVAGVAAGKDGGVLADQAFGERGERGDQLDGGTGNKPRFQSQLLVDDGEDSSRRRVDHDDAAGEGSEGGDGGAADDEIVAIDVIAHGGVDARDFGFVGELFLDATALSRRRSGCAARLQQREGEERDQQKTLHSNRAVLCNTSLIIANVRGNTLGVNATNAERIPLGNLGTVTLIPAKCAGVRVAVPGCGYATANFVLGSWAIRVKAISVSWPKPQSQFPSAALVSQCVRVSMDSRGSRSKAGTQVGCRWAAVGTRSARKQKIWLRLSAVITILSRVWPGARRIFTPGTTSWPSSTRGMRPAATRGS